jgi:PII-like signaling protein
MEIEGPGKEVRVYIGESDRWHGRPLFQALLERLRREGFAGATVLRGMAGFGKASRIHTAHIVRLSEDLPILISIVDTSERVEQLMPILREMVQEGLVTVVDVEIHLYKHGEEEPEA